MKTQLSWLVVALLIGFAWLKAHDGQIRANALAEARGDSLRRELATGDSIRGLLQAKALALDSLKQAQARHYLISKNITRTAQARADSTAAVLDSVLVSLPDTAPLAIAIVNERVAGQSCRYALASCDSLGVLLTHEVANRDSVIAILEPAQQRLRAMWAAAEKRSRPGLFGRIRIGLPFAAAGVIVGALIVR